MTSGPHARAIACDAPRLSRRSTAALRRGDCVIEFSFQIDPHVVLGIAPGATLQEIRDAYRQQAKKHHPDTGGAEWTFRVLAQAYEVLSTARVEQASQNESRGRSA